MIVSVQAQEELSDGAYQVVVIKKSLQKKKISFNMLVSSNSETQID